MSSLFDRLTSLHASSQTLALEDGSTLEILAVVRAVPQRRLVCRGVRDGTPVFAKLFFGDKAGNYAGRDRRGALLLHNAGLLTPALLTASTIGRDCHVLVYAAIETEGNAEDRWRQLQDHAADRFSLVAKLTETVAQHHQAGLIQTDLYFKNFLIGQEGVYTLDGDGIRRLAGGKGARLHNLAVLFSKLDVLDDAWIPDLYRRYCEVCGWQMSDSREIMRMQKCAFHLRRKAVSRYADGKVFRNCTDVQVESRHNRLFALVRKWQGSAAALAFPERYFRELQLKRLKSGNTCTVSLAEVDARQWVFKRYNIKSFWHGLSRALRPSRAAVSWANAHRLVMYGILTAPPVALIEERWGPVRRESYFIAEYTAGPGLGEYLESASPLEEKENIADQVARLCHKLYLLRLEHGDCKATNIRVHNGKALLIDLDAMRQHQCQSLFRQRHLRDLRRLLRNWPAGSQPHQLMVAALKNVYNDDGLLAEAGVPSH